MERLMDLLAGPVQAAKSIISNNKSAENNTNIFDLAKNSINALQTKMSNKDEEYALGVLNGEESVSVNEATKSSNKSYSLTAGIDLLGSGFTSEMKATMNKYHSNAWTFCTNDKFTNLDYSDPKYEQLGKDLTKRFEIWQEIKADPNMAGVMARVSSEYKLEKDQIEDKEIKAEINRRAQDYLISKFDSVNDAMGSVKDGEVFALQDSDNVLIKLSDTEAYELNISSETYTKLFPLVDRCDIAQQNMEDCYVVAPIVSMMENPKTKALLLDCFSEDEDGNIKVTLPNGVDRDKNGETDFSITLGKDQTIDDLFTENSVDKTLSKSALGVQLLEYTLLLNKAYDKDSSLNDDNITPLDDDDNLDYMCEKATIISGNGGQLPSIYKAFGLTVENIDTEKTGAYLEMLNQDNVVATLATVKGSVKGSLPIAEEHGYAISKVEDESGEAVYKITNPWGTKIEAYHELFLSAEEVTNNFYQITYGKFDDASILQTDKMHYVDGFEPIKEDSETVEDKTDVDEKADDKADDKADNSGTSVLKLRSNSGITCPWELVKKLMPNENYTPALYREILNAAGQEDPFTSAHYSDELRMTPELKSLINRYNHIDEEQEPEDKTDETNEKIDDKADNNSTSVLKLRSNSGITCPWELVKKLMPNENYTPALYREILNAAGQEDPFTSAHYSDELRMTPELMELINRYNSK